MLADTLVDLGHEVVWWSSTHSHQRKRLLFSDDQTVEINDRFRLSLLFAGRYARNRSFSRVRHHLRLGKRFLEAAETMERPDVIVVSFPILELLKSAVVFGHRHNIPVVVDVRDPWPDALFNIAPPWVRVLAYPASKWMHSAIGRRIRRCTSVVACSSGFLDWALVLANREKKKTDRIFHLGRLAATKADSEIENVRARFGIPDHAKLFMFVGSFGHVYDLETVCEAAVLARQAGKCEVHVILVGHGDKYDAIQKMAEGVETVTLTGWLGSSDVLDLLGVADVGLAPCDQMPGCVPNKISEYAAAGLPILSSLRGDMVALLRRYNAGSSYEAGNAAELCDQMTQLATTPSLLESQREGSRSMFANEFNAEDIYPRYVAHIEQMVEDFES